MALGRLITYFLFSSTLLLLLLLLPSSESSQLVGDAARHINVNGRNANAIGTSPFFCTAVTLAVCGCVTVVVYWMLFAYLYLKSLNNKNSSAAASSDEDDFNDEYGIMSRRRIRTPNQWAKSSAGCAYPGQ